MKKTIYLILAAVLAMAFGVTPALATVSSVGTISDPGHPAGRSPKLPYAGAATPVIVSAPASVLPEAYTHNTEIRVFDEQQNVTLTAPLSVDQTTDSLTSSAVISAGTVVNSHYIHLDNIGTSLGVRGLGQVTFDGPIIGVITQDSALYASHSVLGASGTTYPTSGLYRGLEQGTGGVGDYPARNWTQQDIIWISGNTITIDLQVFNVLDSFRVITEPESEPFITNLCAGQDIEIGNTIVENDGTTLSVTYEITEPGWLLVETHLEVVENEEDFPTTKKGNPQVGHFTWSKTHDPPVESFTYTIPLADIGDGVVAGDPVYVAAHAAVVKIIGEGQEETAWGGACDDELKGAGVVQRFVEKGNWATYFAYQVQGTQCDLLGDWSLEYWFSGGGFAAGHNMSITEQDQDGFFDGTGYSVTGPQWTWDVTGTITGSTETMTITYDQSVGGTYPYIVSLTGAADICEGLMTGTATDNRGNSFTWTATRFP